MARGMLPVEITMELQERGLPICSGSNRLMRMVGFSFKSIIQKTEKVDRGCVKRSST